MKEERYNSAKTGSSGLYFNIGLTISLLCVITAFEWKFEESPEPYWEADITRFEDVFFPPITRHEIPEPQKPMKTSVVDQVIEAKTEPLAINQVVPIFTPEIRLNGKLIPGPFVGAPKAEDPPIEFMLVEKQPGPKGGMDAFYDFIGRNLKYPKRALLAGIGGETLVEFVVDTNGRLTEVKVLKGIGFGCDEEAVRVLSLAPPWNPGKQRGVPVKVRMRMPIAFSIR